MKPLFKSLGAGIVIWMASLMPAHAQTAAGWKALHYAAQNSWFCTAVQAYPGFEDGFVRPTLELHFDIQGEEPHLTGNLTEHLKQFSGTGEAGSAKFKFGAHVFDSPQEGTGIYIESQTLVRINQELEPPFGWPDTGPWVRLQILTSPVGDPYRITGKDGDGASYTCSAIPSVEANRLATVDRAEEELVDLHATLDSLVQELGAARYYYEQGHMREQACEASRSARNKLERAGNEIREISSMMSGSAFNDVDRANWAEQLGPLQESLRDGNNAAMNYWSATC